MINIQSTLPTAPDLCKNVPLQGYLVATVFIYSLHTAVRYVYIYTYNSQYGDAGQVKEIKQLGEQ